MRSLHERRIGCRAWLRSHVGFCVCLALAVALIGFIFGNSLENGPESMQTSNAVVEVVKPIVDPQDQINDEQFSFSIRKLAHFTEFFWLGMALCGVVVCAVDGRRGKKPILSHPPVCAALLTALSVAVADELIQSFTARTSSVRDVLLEYLGALCGFFLTALVRHIVRSLLRRCKR